jgi:regulator of sirC expression with transglutaminase-like and TPR domain
MPRQSTIMGLETSMSARSRKTFQQLVTLPDGAIPLAEAALLMACEEYPQLEISPFIDQLDEMAEAVRATMREKDSPRETIDKINNVLFDVLGFRGNTDNYYDPRNSFFNDVLERRVGIPITLSAVYLEVARRLALPIVGVGMPGRFLVKYRTPLEEVILDPFNRGEILEREDCKTLLTQHFGEAVIFTDRMLERVTHRQILARMLNNLKVIYLKAQTYDKGLAMVDMMLMVQPEDVEQYRDRGLLNLQLRKFEAAAKDLDHYLKVVPDSEDKEEIEEHLRELKRIRAMMN